MWAISYFISSENSRAGWRQQPRTRCQRTCIFFCRTPSSLFPSSPSLPLYLFLFPPLQTPVQNGCPLQLHPHNVQMKNEVIPLDRLVISQGTTAGKLPVRVCLKRRNCFPGGLGFEYVIFQCIIGGLEPVRIQSLHPSFCPWSLMLSVNLSRLILSWFAHTFAVAWRPQSYTSCACASVLVMDSFIIFV